MSSAQTPSSVSRVGQNDSSSVARDQKLEDDIQWQRKKVLQHEENIKYLKNSMKSYDQAIAEMQVTLAKHRPSNELMAEGEDPSHTRSLEETIDRILQYEKSAAGLLCELTRCGYGAAQISSIKEVVGVVATLGHVVEDINLSRLLSEYLGLDTMLALVCRTYDGVKTLETYEEGVINRRTGLYGLGASIRRVLDGRFIVICLEDLIPYPGEFMPNDPQKRLALLKPKLPNGESPAGFIGFAVNMLYIGNAYLSLVTTDGHGLRETLFYHLFSRLQVYRTRADMLQALPFISNGAISLDGGIIRGHGVFALGTRKEMDVTFPICSGDSFQSEDYIEIENQMRELKWKKDKMMEDIKREECLLAHAKYNFEVNKEELIRFMVQRPVDPMLLADFEGEQDDIPSKQGDIPSKQRMVSKGTRKSLRLIGKTKLDKSTNEASNPLILDPPEVGDDGQDEQQFFEREEMTKTRFDRTRKQGDNQDQQKDDSFELVLKRNDAKPIQRVKGKRQRESKVSPEEMDQEESDSDESSKEFVPALPKETGKRKRQKTRAHKSKKTYFCTRTSPKTMFSLLQELTVDQKRAVEEMGFGSLLQFKVDGVPSKLGLYVVDKFDEGSMELKFNNRRLQITKEAVHEMFGIPMGETKLEDVVNDEEEESSVVAFKSIHGKEYVRPHEVLKYITTTKTTDWYFRMNFLVLFANILGECMRNGNCNTNILIHIKRNTDVSKIDWCTFILDCLVKTKRPWNKYNPNSNYTGPITFLMLFYVDNTCCLNFPVRRLRPATKVWTMELLRQREAAEVDGPGLGFVDILPPYVEEEPLLSLEPPPCNQQYKDDQERRSALATPEDHEALINEAVSKLEMVVKDSIIAFPNINVSIFSKRCEELFASVMLYEKTNQDTERCEAQDSDQGYKTPLPIDHVEEQDTTYMIYRTMKTVGSLKGVDDFFVPSFSLLSQETPPREKQVSGDAKCVDESKKGSSGDGKGEYEREHYQEAEHVVVAEKEDQKAEEEKKEVREEKEQGDEEDNEQCEESKVEQGIDAKPLSIVATEEQCEERGERETKPTLELKSSFLNRAVQVNKMLTVAEKKVSRALFSMQKPFFDVIFESREGISSVRLTMESLVPKAYISYDVIDTWAHILNCEEQFRSIGSPLRFFGTTSMFHYRKFKNEKITHDSKYNDFKEEFTLQLKKHKLQLSLIDIDMIMFPILQDDHFWLLVFNLKNPACIVLDNSGHDVVFDEKYLLIPQTLQIYLTTYMEMIHHPRLAEMKALKPERWEMDCRTLHNKVDCGVFLMRHMEVYKGEPENKWDCEIGKEIPKQQQILERLRARYATKILLSDINLHKEKVREEAEEFAKIPFDDQEVILFKATSNMKARWDYCKM